MITRRKIRSTAEEFWPIQSLWPVHSYRSRYTLRDILLFVLPLCSLLQVGCFGLSVHAVMPPKRKDPEPAGEWSSLLEGKWAPYNSDDTVEIEKAWEAAQAKGAAKKVVITSLSFSRGVAYEFDFDKMTQTNMSTKRSRKVQRKAVAAAAASSAPPPLLKRASATSKALPPAKTAKAPAPKDDEDDDEEDDEDDDADDAKDSDKKGESSTDYGFGTTLGRLFTRSAARVAPAASASPSKGPDRSAWALDSKLPDPPALSADEIRAQARLGAQSRRGRGGAADNFGTYISKNKHATHCFQRMLENEVRLSGEWTVFYHSYSHAALLYEVQAAIAAVLFRFRSNYGCLPRLFRGVFSDIPDAPAMMKEFPKWRDQDHNPRFKSVGICATCSLLAMDHEAPATNVFLGGYSVGHLSTSIIENMLKECGVSAKDCKEMTKKIVKLAEDFGLSVAAFGGKHCRSGQSGHLLQIFMKRNLVDKYAYAAMPMGVPDKKRHPLGKYLMSDGSQKGPYGCFLQGQARIVVHPSAFLQSGKVRMYTYSADPHFHDARSDFQDQLTTLLKTLLGNEATRAKAAKGIFGGTLPGWFNAEDQRQYTSKEAADKSPSIKRRATNDWK